MRIFLTPLLFDAPALYLPFGIAGWS